MTHVYIFFWNNCIYESAPYPVSIHFTMAGAYKAMRKLLLEDYEENLTQRRWSDRITQRSLYLKYGESKRWYISKTEIQP